MKSPPDAEDEVLPAVVVALLDAPDPLPDCRQPVNVISLLLRELLLPVWPEVDPVVDPVEEPAPEPAPDPAPP